MLVVALFSRGQCSTTGTQEHALPVRRRKTVTNSWKTLEWKPVLIEGCQTTRSPLYLGTFCNYSLIHSINSSPIISSFICQLPFTTTISLCSNLSHLSCFFFVRYFSMLTLAKTMNPKHISLCKLHQISEPYWESHVQFILFVIGIARKPNR